MQFDIVVITNYFQILSNEAKIDNPEHILFK